MPYYQYDSKTENCMKENTYELEQIEKKEIVDFEELLARKNNTFQELLDIFYPPIYRIKPDRRRKSCPTLQQSYRKNFIEIVEDGIAKGMLNPIGTRLLIEEEKMAFEKIKTLVTELEIYELRPTYCPTPIDFTDNINLSEKSVLLYEFETRSFIKFMMGRARFPQELLNLDCFVEIYKEFNNDRIRELEDELTEQDDWYVYDFVSLISGVRVLRRQTFYAGEYGECRKVSLGVEKKLPLRHLEHQDVDKPQRGRIDTEELPPILVQHLNNWNCILKQVHAAMRYPKKNNIGFYSDTNYKHIDATLDPSSFLQWTDSKGEDYNIPDKLKALHLDKMQNTPILETIKPARENVSDIKSGCVARLKKSITKIPLGKRQDYIPLVVNVTLEIVEQLRPSFNRFDMPGVKSCFFSFIKKLLNKLDYPIDLPADAQEFVAHCKYRDINRRFKKEDKLRPICGWETSRTKDGEGFWDGILCEFFSND